LFEEEHERFEKLVRSMPPVCRAFAHDKYLAVEPEPLLASYITAVVDAFVRHAASRLRLRPRVIDTEGARFAAALIDTGGVYSESKGIIRSL
jgi:hypothetical protein